MRQLACALLAGGTAGNHLHKYKGLETERSRQTFDFEHQETVTVPHAYYGEVQKSSFRSPPVKLMNGEAWFTLPDVNKMPMPKPGKPYAIVMYHPDIIDETGRQPPLSEMYAHHWLIFDQPVGGSGDNMGCGGGGTFVSNEFGAGAEMRGVHYDYPNGYGYFSTQGSQQWSANLHFINTVDLSAQHFADQPDPHGAAIKACIECNWSPGNTGIGCTKNSKGNFGCCIDGGRCLTNDMKNKTKTTYYLTYDVFWTTDLSQLKPVRHSVIDTFACASLGNIAPNMKTKTHTCDDKVCVGEIERTSDKDGEIVLAYGHQHVGAINASLYHNGEYVCTSKAVYGTDPANPIGNEQGYVTGLALCLHGDAQGGAVSNRTISVKKGDKLKVTSMYSVEEVDKRILPMPGGEHGGVMGLFYFDLSETGDYKCSGGQCIVTNKDGVDLPTCQSQCGAPPVPPTPAALYACKGGSCVPAASGADIDTCRAAC